MAQILDKQGLQHYANKMCNADNRKVGSKSLPAALNEIDTAIDGFKTLFETEYGTPVNMELENNENIFSIGTGTNINKKDDVENSFTDIELSGNSLVNLYIKTVPVAIQGIMTNNNDTYTITRGESSTSTTYLQFELNSSLFKANTTYTVILTGYSTSSTNSDLCFYDRNNAKDICRIRSSTLKNNSIGVFNFVDYNSKRLQFLVYAESVTNASVSCNSNILILEGDWTNKTIPQYFEGLKSIGEKEDGNHKIEILSQNKNLFNYEEYYKYCPSTKTDNKTILSHSGDLRPGNHDIFFSSPMKVTLKPNTTYTFCLFNLKDSKQVLNCEGCLSTAKSELRLKVEIGQIGYKVFTTNSINYKDGVSFKINTSAGEKARYKIMIIEGNIMPSDYIHYDSDKKEILLNEPLRGLPNGVKDSVEKVNGEWKIIRRCKEAILTKDYNITTAPSYINGVPRFGIDINDLKNLDNVDYNRNNIQCDSIPLGYVNGVLSGQFGIFQHNNSKSIHIYLPIEKMPTNTVNGFKQWLQTNPTKVIYELATPIIEDISPVILQCWKNGTISIDEVLPVETTHTVALNKSAQIQKNIEELTILRNRVKALEEQYDKTALNQAYEVELLKLDMQLDNII